MKHRLTTSWMTPLSWPEGVCITFTGTKQLWGGWQEPCHTKNYKCADCFTVYIPFLRLLQRRKTIQTPTRNYCYHGKSCRTTKETKSFVWGDKRKRKREATRIKGQSRINIGPALNSSARQSLTSQVRGAVGGYGTKPKLNVYFQHRDIV